jgi:hypothetical protein
MGSIGNSSSEQANSLRRVEPFGSKGAVRAGGYDGQGDILPSEGLNGRKGQQRGGEGTIRGVRSV